MVAIDIGAPAIDRGANYTSNYTFINRNNPANATGTITSVEIWASSSLANAVVGTFYVVSGNTLKCRDSEAIGTVTEGAKRTFGVTLNVVAGDYLGLYFTHGAVELDTDDAVGSWYLLGSHMTPGEQDTYTLDTDNIFSAYGRGTTPVLIPTVTTQAADNIGVGAGTLHGTITATGDENASERGFDYDYDSGTPYASEWTETDSYGVGPFEKALTGLNQGVTVYFRAKAQNTAGWGYGGELSFKTGTGWSKILTEPLGLLDATVKKDVSITKTEPLGLVDTYSRTWTAYRTYSELLGLVDSVSKGVTLPLTESLGLVDTVFKGPSIVKSEALGLVDVYSRTWSIYRTHTELLGLLDSIQKEPGKVLSEPLGLVDTYSRTWTIYRTYTEILGLVDTYSRTWTIYRTYSEILGLLDSVAYTENPTILAQLIRKLIQLEEIGGGRRK